MAQHPPQAPQPSPATQPAPAKPSPAAQPAPATQQQPQQQFEGKLVKKMRDAKSSDPNFMENTDQVVITLDDGAERTVRRNELTEVPK
jgi:hypothetical protein